MMTQEQHQFPCPTKMDNSYTEGENRMLRKMKDNPFLPIATLGAFGVAGWRIYQARNRGGQKLSFYLIHTRLAAQGLAVACLGSMVLYSLGQRAMNGFKESDE